MFHRRQLASNLRGPALGGWKVMRGSKKIAVAKANGTCAYPVNLCNLSGKRIARCGIVRGTWRVERVVYGFAWEILASVPKGCPERVAIGAIRLVYWP